MRGIYSRNKLFDATYLAGAQELPELEKDVYVDDATTITIFDSYEDCLIDDWPEFIRDFCE